MNIVKGKTATDVCAVIFIEWAVALFIEEKDLVK